MRTEFSAHEERATLLRARIADAVAAHLAEHGTEGLTVVAVAKRARVPVATAYRHFAGKQALLEAYDAWIRERLGVPQYETTLEQWPAQVVQAFTKFDTIENVVRGQLARPRARGSFRHVRDKRLVAVEKMLAPLLAQLDERDRLSVLGVVGTLTGGHAWQLQKDDWGVDGRAAGEATAWALEVLLRELRAHPRALRRPAGAGVASKPRRKR